MISSIKCSICLDVMVEAVALRCGHSFCQMCLDDAINVDDRCPECRRHSNGILIPNLRLNDCIYHILRGNTSQLNDFHRRRIQNRIVMSIRREARAVLFSILHESKRALSRVEIEDQWKTLRHMESFPEMLRSEMIRIVRSSPKIFEVTVENSEERVALKSFAQEGRR
ncbi:hypothetical protein Q1695_015976 [Nippostrongylus brasiliensis]|nr:hypothetical protein Q1695_015966 [Nippostrongylus brasiliensis]WKY02357.1 hypothetical protein Q1695_015976 [Nippostrongylus brasiliensis]